MIPGDSRQGRTNQGAAAGRCSATLGGTTELGAEKGATVGARGRVRAVARQGDHQTGQTPVEGNNRAATALEGGGVAGTQRRHRDGARGSQGPSGRTTAGTQRRRRDHATARRDANAEHGRARTLARQGDGRTAAQMRRRRRCRANPRRIFLLLALIPC